MDKEIAENILIFQKMVNVSNNSLFTQQLCWNICDSLNDDVKIAFYKWLVLAEKKLNNNSQHG